MKRLLFSLLLSIGGISAPALAGNSFTFFESSKHYIRIICNSDDCIYQSWNKPKLIAQGKPDLEIKKGFHQSFNTGSVWIFNKGDIEYDIDYTTAHCITIYKKAKIKARYPIHQIK